MLVERRTLMGIQKKAKVSKLNEKQKKILNIIITVAQVVLVLVAVVASIIILVNPTGATIREKGITLMPVLSDSMDGDQEDSFKEGDLLIVHAPDAKKYDPTKLVVGDIITFEWTVAGQKIYNTHRIVDVDVFGDSVVYTARGDNPNILATDTQVVPANKVLGICTGSLKGVGKTISFLQTPLYFLLVILLPLALLFIYNIVLFVKMIMEQKLAKVGALGGSEEDETARKQRIIDEYLASQQKQEENKVEVEETEAEEPGDEE
jgi:signal peptidase